MRLYYLVLVLVFLLASCSAPGVDVSTQVADDAILVLLYEYNFDFEPSYRTIQEASALPPGSCASRFLFDVDPDACAILWASRRWDFTTDTSSGFLAYAVFEDEESASSYLNETIERMFDPNELVPLIRWDTEGLAGFSTFEQGADVDEFLAVQLAAADGGILFFLAQRMGSVVLVSYENSLIGRIDRRFTFATTIADHERTIRFYNLSFDGLG